MDIWFHFLSPLVDDLSVSFEVDAYIFMRIKGIWSLLISGSKLINQLRIIVSIFYLIKESS
jgi:hypothetical protein